MTEPEPQPKPSPVDLGFAGTGTSLSKSAGLAAGGAIAISLLMEAGLYPDSLTVRGHVIQTNGPQVVAAATAAATWIINAVRKFIMRHQG